MNLMRFLLNAATACVLILCGASAHAQEASSSITAIDILLEPDATMLRHAETNNARLLQVYRKGFALDATHTPHITLLQCFVHTADLEKVYAAVEKVLAAAHVDAMKLEAFKLYYLPAGGGLGVAGICAEPTPEIVRLQQDIIAAAAPFNLRNGSIGAFTAGHDNPAIDKAVIDYVSAFEKIGAGEKFNPHVSTGNAPTEYLDKMIAEPFAPFTFSPAGAAVYQLGPFGTAAKRLKEWNFTATLSGAVDPLPSWNDGPAKQAIVAFVQKVTKPGSPEFVPVGERIATFDNDGTLWCEKPLPVQLYFALDRVKALAPQHPEWKTQEPFAALLKGDLNTAAAGGEHAIMELMMATHTGNTTEEFEKIVQNWVATAKHPVTGQRFLDMTYQPMLEVLAYLRANGFKNFVVSGGGIEFMRPWMEQAYGIPPEQVVGSSVKTQFELRDVQPVIVRLPELNFNDDKGGKPVGINQHIGRRPIAAFGNSDGDLQMLQYTGASSGARLCLYVHHDDAVREYAYDRSDHLARLDKGLDEAVAKGWTVVSMKDDWKAVFAHEEK